MAIYHLHTKVFSRSTGRNALACAAYRSGEVLTDERHGRRHRHGNPHRVAHTEIVAPVGASSWCRDRNQLWNRVEAGERRKDSQLAREFEVALPNELSLEQQVELLRAWVADEVTPHGAIADVAIHLAGLGKPHNDHAHIMTTMRAPVGEGWSPKLRNLNWDGTMDRWRASWSKRANEALERAGFEERIDHRSHADRDLDLEPTIKEGPAARGIEERGDVSDRMAENRAILARNRERQRQRERRERLAQMRDQVLRSNRPVNTEKPNDVARAPDHLTRAARLDFSASKFGAGGSGSVRRAAAGHRVRGLPGRRVGPGRRPADLHVHAIQRADARAGHEEREGLRRPREGDPNTHGINNGLKKAGGSAVPTKGARGSGVRAQAAKLLRERGPGTALPMPEKAVRPVGLGKPSNPTQPVPSSPIASKVAPQPAPAAAPAPPAPARPVPSPPPPASTPQTEDEGYTLEQLAEFARRQGGQGL